MARKKSGKKAKKPNQPMPTKARSRTRPNQGPAANTMALARAVCAITDPFCPAAEGSKWPDQTAGNSLAITVKGRVALATNASGDGAVIFNPTWATGYDTSTTVTAGVVTWNTNWTVFPTTTSYATVSGYRLVSGGVRFVKTLADNNNQGMLFGVELAPMDAASVQNTNFLSLNYTSCQSHALSSKEGMTATFRPLGSESRTYKKTTTQTIASTTSNDWTLLCFGVTGCAASAQTVGYLEYTLHYELIFAQSDAMNLVSTKAAPPKPLLTDASSAVQSGASAFFQGALHSVEQNFMQRAQHALFSVGRMAASAAVARIAGPSAGMSAYAIMDAD